HNIDPIPVEESLLAHPAVTGAAVVGRPDPYSGEVPIAYVTVGGEPVSEADLLAWGKEHAPEPAAAPKAVHVIDAIPVTAVGKPAKSVLVADSIAGLARTRRGAGALSVRPPRRTRRPRGRVTGRAPAPTQECRSSARPRRAGPHPGRGTDSTRRRRGQPTGTNEREAMCSGRGAGAANGSTRVFSTLL
ncbi:MAG: hypothetical protein HOV68_17085, partial [Streptomycetaceae bacterium]|nr:hypothetical protein [Streptomycetaceae bacterium]